MTEVDEEELRAKLWMRSVTRRAGRVLFFLFLLFVLLLGGVQAVLVRGPGPLLLWGPLVVYAVLAARQARARNWGLALACALAAGAYARVYRQAADARAQSLSGKTAA